MPSTTEVAALEDMSYVFGVPTKRHVEYQIKEHLPWQFKRLRNRFLPSSRKEDLEPLNSLYTWHRSRVEGAVEVQGDEEVEEEDEGQLDVNQPPGGIAMARLH